jgi:hypothetical protein
MSYFRPPTIDLDLSSQTDGASEKKENENKQSIQDSNYNEK